MQIQLLTLNDAYLLLVHTINFNHVFTIMAIPKKISFGRPIVGQSQPAIINYER